MCFNEAGNAVAKSIPLTFVKGCQLHAYIMLVCMHVGALVRMLVCMLLCISACVHAHVCACVCTRAYACVYLLVCMLT